MIPVQKQIERVPAAVMDVLATHCWPGNIRELQNFIQRSVIFTPGNTLRPPLARPRPAAQADPPRATHYFGGHWAGSHLPDAEADERDYRRSERCRCSAGSETY